MTTDSTLTSNDDSLTDKNQKHQQRKENRKVITPYAFEVSPDLFGTPLASPSRRACALLIDLCLVAALSGVTGNALAIFIAILLWMSSRRILKERGRNYAVILLRVVASLLVLGGFLGFLSDIDSGDKTARVAQKKLVNDDGSMEAQNAIKIAVLSGKYLLQGAQIQEKLDAGECPSTLICWQQMGEDFTTDLVEVEIPENAEKDVLDTFLELSSEALSAEEFANFNESVSAAFYAKKASYSPHGDGESDINKDAFDASISSLVENAQTATEEADSIEINSERSESEYSILNWIEGIIKDLGLGFGWAAAYFTATMAWLKGQTIGKKVLRIKVIKLDGSALNVLESFGRYGGYGAGLATGLMGFLQVFWDPNRQAIQDKISETLVIKIQ